MERITDSSRVRIEGDDFVEFNDKFIIYNVPIIAELVQPYSDGNAYKPASEIKNVKVDNVPLTMRADVPDHPDNHLEGQSTEFKAEQVVGFMSNPSKPKKVMSDKKRYADFVFYKNDLTSLVLDKYKKGDFIDTSIGFVFEKDNTKGVFNGVSYDYVQRNINLDHNAVLLDSFGRVGVGRMPSPIGGIGADTNKKFLEEKKMVEKTIDALEGQLKKLTIERDEAIKELKNKNDSLMKDAQEKVKKEIDVLNKAKDEAEKKFVEVSDELKKYKDKEVEELENMRKELVDANEDFKDLFASANDDLIRSYHAKLLEKQKTDSVKGRNIAIDMMGPKNNQGITEKERTSNWLKKKEAK